MIAYRPDVALLVVDVQNDFADPRGGLAVPGGSEVVPVVNAEVRRAVDAGAPVFYSQDWHPPATPHFAKDGGIWPVHCVQGTWGAELHPDLIVRGPVVRKGSHGEDGYSAFSMQDARTGETQATELRMLLDTARVRTLVVCGLATDYCVRATVLDARALGFETLVLEPAIRAVDLVRGDGRRAIEDMRRAGARILEEEAPGTTSGGPVDAGPAAGRAHGDAGD